MYGNLLTRKASPTSSTCLVGSVGRTSQCQRRSHICYSSEEGELRRLTADGRSVHPNATATAVWFSLSDQERAEYRSLFMPKRNVQPFVQLDHVKRRRDKEMEEIAQSAKRVGLSREQVDDSVAKLESLLPDLAPNLDKMKASDWVTLIKDPERVAVMLVMLKSYYPGVNISRIISKRPKLLLQDVKAMEEDAKKVHRIFEGKLPDLDAVIEEVPDLMNPAQAMLSLSNLRRWFPLQDPYELLQKNPSLLNNVEEADLKPDPTYGAEVGVMD